MRAPLCTLGLRPWCLVRIGDLERRPRGGGVEQHQFLEGEGIGRRGMCGCGAVIRLPPGGALANPPSRPPARGMCEGLVVWVCREKRVPLPWFGIESLHPP